MLRRPRMKRNLDKDLNPNDHFDPKKGAGKDPDLSGPREDETVEDPLGTDPSNVREHNPRHRAARNQDP